MKKELISLALLMLPAIMLSQELISNADFSQEVTAQVGNPARVNGGEWFFFNVAKEGESLITYNAEDENVKIENQPGDGAVGWNKVYVGQRLKNAGLEKGVYRITFEVKSSEKKAQVGTYMKKTVENAEIDPKTGHKHNNFFIQADYNFDDPKNEKRSGALATEWISNTWMTVGFEFSTENTISAHNTKKMNETLYVKPVTDDMLNDCFLAIYCPTKGATLWIDNVKMEKMK